MSVEMILISISVGFAFISIVLMIMIFLKAKAFDLRVLNEKLDFYEKNLKDEFERNRKESSENERNSRKESQETLLNFQNSINGKLDLLTKNTQDSLTSNLTKFMGTLSERFDSLAKTTQDTLNIQKQTVQTSLKEMQESNEKKLEQMRLTVDEKLQSTLEKRLNSSFELVSKQLEAVQKGLGEMQTLASDVGGLKRALTNVKSAGGMGEVQLEALLSDVLSPNQYEKNAHPNPANSRGVVEFAVKLPSKDNSRDFIYLPIDSKYPATVWDKLTLAYETGDKSELELQRKELVGDIRKFAKDIKEKYIQEPYTTNFGVMFLPFEGLYSEVTRIPGLFQQIQDDYKVTITGPTTLNAFLNSLQMGFRTLAIQKETSKVWELLGSVKTEFGKFGDVLAATKKKLESATTEIEKAETRTRVIEKKLLRVETLPGTEALRILQFFRSGS